MIDLTAFERTSLYHEPYIWAPVPGMFSPRDASSLVASYPSDSFKTVSGYDGEKGYEYEARSLVAMGTSEPSHPGHLKSAWRKLAQDLVSPEYRAAIAKLTGCDLTQAAIEANLFHYGVGAWMGPHVDLKDKIVTHILYFNDTRAGEHGGYFRVLRSADPNDVFTEVPPVVGNSVVVVRSDRSWHMVSQVTEASSVSRRSVTVTFYRPGSISTMWPPGDQPSLHSYPGARAKNRLFSRLEWLSLFNR
jgi:SM-20-related protein